MTEKMTHFFHACRTRDLDAILRDGLDPEKSRSSTKGVYLTNDRYTAENYTNMDPEAAWTILSLEPRVLDQSLLRPDDYEFPELLEAHDPDDLIARGLDENIEWQDCDWRLSLEISNQVCYLGKIEGAFLTVVPPLFGQQP